MCQAFYLQSLQEGWTGTTQVPEFLPQKPREQLIYSKRQKKQSGACSGNNLGTKLRDGSSCGSGTVQHYHISTTLLRRLHYSQVWIHLFPLECKMPQCDPAQLLIATHICSSSSQPSHHPSTVTPPPPPQISYKIHTSKEERHSPAGNCSLTI